MQAYRLSLAKSRRAIAEEALFARSFFERTKGLLGRQKLEPNQALILDRCCQVHMLFMRFRIDVVFCSAQWEVMRLVQELKPWRISPYVFGARDAIELPSGTIKRFEIEKGAIINLEPQIAEEPSR